MPITVDWTVTFGQMLPYIVAFVSLVGGVVLTWFVNKVKNAILVEISKMFGDMRVENSTAIANAAKELKRELADESKDLNSKIFDTNERFSTVAAGFVELKKELAAFKEHVGQHYVEKNEIAELRTSIDKALNRIETGFERATATMDDVRDSVIALTASRGKSTVPAKRRAAPKTVGA